MESSYKLQDDLLYLRASGEVTVDALIDLITRSREDRAYRPGISSVCDLREGHAHWDFSEIQRYRDFIVHIAGTHQRRWATVVRPGGLAATLRVVILISDQVKDVIQMQVFEDPEKARLWALRQIE